MIRVRLDSDSRLLHVSIRHLVLSDNLSVQDQLIGALSFDCSLADSSCNLLWRCVAQM